MGNFDTAFEKLFGSIKVTPQRSEYHYDVDLYRNSMIKAQQAEVFKNLGDEKYTAMAEKLAAGAVELEAKAFASGVDAAKKIAFSEKGVYLDEAAAKAKFLADVEKVYLDIKNYPAYTDRVKNLAPSLIKATAHTVTEAEVVAIEEKALQKTAASAAEHAALTTTAKKILTIVAHVGPLGNALAVAEIAKALLDNGLIHPDNAESMATYSNPDIEVQNQADIVANQIMNQLVNQNAPTR